MLNLEIQNYTINTFIPRSGKGDAYSYVIQTDGGYGNLTWTLTDGTLPDGITLESDGELLATNVTGIVGTYNFDVHSIDEGGNEATASLSITVEHQIIINPEPWNVVAGSNNIGATSTIDRMAFDIRSLGYNWHPVSAYGSIVPGTATSFKFGAAQNSNDISVGAELCATASLTSISSENYFTTYPSFIKTNNYVVYLQVLAGDGSLLSIDNTDPYIYTNRGINRLTNAFTSISDSNKIAVKIGLEIEELLVSTSSLSGGVKGSTYSVALTSSGGFGTKTWSKLSGTLPDGIVLSSGGVLSSSNITASPATYTFIVQVEDEDGTTDSKELSINITKTTITNSTLIGGILGATYLDNTSMAANNGIAPYSYSKVSGDSWVSISSSGEVSGTVGLLTTSIVVLCTDANGITDQKTFTITSTKTSITTTEIQDIYVSEFFTQTFTANYGTAPYTWEKISGTWPSGFTFTTAGVLSGTTTDENGDLVDIKCTDANGIVATKQFWTNIFPFQLEYVFPPVFFNGAVIDGTFYDVGGVTEVGVKACGKDGTWQLLPNTESFPKVNGTILNAECYDKSKGFIFYGKYNGTDWYFGYNTRTTVELEARATPYSYAPGTIPAGLFDAAHIASVVLYLKSEAGSWTSFSMTLTDGLWEKYLVLPTDFLLDEDAGMYFKLIDIHGVAVYYSYVGGVYSETDARSITLKIQVLVEMANGEKILASSSVLQDLQEIEPIEAYFYLQIPSVIQPYVPIVITYGTGGGGAGGGGGAWGGVGWTYVSTEVGPPGMRRRYTKVYNKDQQLLYYRSGGLATFDENEAIALATVPPEIITNYLPDASYGEYYSVRMRGDKGTPPYVWSYTSPTSIDWITLDEGGLLYGESPNSENFYSLTFTLTDQNFDTDVETFTLHTKVKRNKNNYRFKIGEVDAFRERQLIPIYNRSIVYTGANDRIDRDNTFDSYGAREYQRLAVGGTISLIKPAGVDVENYSEGDVSKVFLLTNLFGDSASGGTFDFYYRLINEPNSTWTLSRTVVLSEQTSGVIKVFEGLYNVYEFKLVITAGIFNFFGFYTYKYVTRNFQIFDYNYAFDFEINPTTWKHAFDGGSIYSSLSGNIMARGSEFSSSKSNSSRGKIDLSFDFIRGASTDEVATYSNMLDINKTLNSLMHSDKYKLEYLARRQQQVIFVGDEEMNIDTDWTFGRIGYLCRISPGTMKFVRNLNKIGRTINGKNTEYQESYSANFSLVDLQPVI